jgi:hypothetical protein
MSEHSTDMLIFLAVVSARFLVPLAIPKFPLPAEIAAMLLDAVDQTIFQQFTKLDLTGYQSYDKALDVYYLSIIYLSTMRNWVHLFAFEASRFLYFYRLVGVVLFEATQTRAFLLIFPNTFEYFFIFYEAVRLRWNPLRMSKRLVIGAVAFIWIFIKLPQEYWIHIAQVDTTDLIKEDIFGVPVDTGWGEIVSDFPWVFIGLAILLVAIILGIRWVFAHKLPPAEWKLSFDADAHGTGVTDEEVQVQSRMLTSRIWARELLEKIVMMSMIIFIFSKIVPGTDTTNLQLAGGVAVMVLINAGLSEWFARRGRTFAAAVSQFVTMAAINAGIIVAFDQLAAWRDRSFHIGAALFFTLMLTLLIVLYDRYRPIYLARVAKAEGYKPI